MARAALVLLCCAVACSAAAAAAVASEEAALLASLDTPVAAYLRNPEGFVTIASAEDAKASTLSHHYKRAAHKAKYGAGGKDKYSASDKAPAGKDKYGADKSHAGGKYGAADKVKYGAKQQHGGSKAGFGHGHEDALKHKQAAGGYHAPKEQYQYPKGDGSSHHHHDKKPAQPEHPAVTPPTEVKPVVPEVPKHVEEPAKEEPYAGWPEYPGQEAPEEEEQASGEPSYPGEEAKPTPKPEDKEEEHAEEHKAPKEGEEYPEKEEPSAPGKYEYPGEDGAEEYAPTKDKKYLKEKEEEKEEEEEEADEEEPSKKKKEEYQPGGEDEDEEEDSHPKKGDYKKRAEEAEEEAEEEYKEEDKHSKKEEVYNPKKSEKKKAYKKPEPKYEEEEEETYEQYKPKPKEQYKPKYEETYKPKYEETYKPKYEAKKPTYKEDKPTYKEEDKKPAYKKEEKHYEEEEDTYGFADDNKICLQETSRVYPSGAPVFYPNASTPTTFTSLVSCCDPQGDYDVYESYLGRGRAGVPAAPDAPIGQCTWTITPGAPISENYAYGRRYGYNGGAPYTGAGVARMAATVEAKCVLTNAAAAACIPFGDFKHGGMVAFSLKRGYWYRTSAAAPAEEQPSNDYASGDYAEEDYGYGSRYGRYAETAAAKKQQPAAKAAEAKKAGSKAKAMGKRYERADEYYGGEREYYGGEREYERYGGEGRYAYGDADAPIVVDAERGKADVFMGHLSHVVEIEGNEYEGGKYEDKYGSKYGRRGGYEDEDEYGSGYNGYGSPARGIRGGVLEFVAGFISTNGTVLYPEYPAGAPVPVFSPQDLTSEGAIPLVKPGAMWLKFDKQGKYEEEHAHDKYGTKYGSKYGKQHKDSEYYGEQEDEDSEYYYNPDYYKEGGDSYYKEDDSEYYGDDDDFLTYRAAKKYNPYGGRAPQYYQADSPQDYYYDPSYVEEPKYKPSKGDRYYMNSDYLSGGSGYEDEYYPKGAHHGTKHHGSKHHGKEHHGKEEFYYPDAAEDYYYNPGGRR